MTKPLIAIAALALLAPAACVNEVEEGQDFFEPEDDRENEIFQGVYDCTEHTDDGYRSGSRFTITVVKADAKPIEVNTANAYIAMQNKARQAGVNIRIVSGFRTMDQQEYLYGCYTHCNCNSCNLAARPGYSNHQSGHALDLNTSDAGVLSWLNNHADEYGFRRTVSSEPWHWEWWGSDSDFDGPCGGEGGGGSVGGGGGSSGGAGGTLPATTTPADCEALPASGGTIDDGDACFVPGGPSQYLRAVDGQGNDDDLLWTGTTNHSSAVNFAEWHVKVPAGRYVVEAYVDADVGNPSRQAKYAVQHAGTVDRILVSQQSTGWKSLGAFTFAGTGSEKIRVDDNTGEAGSLERKLVFDAIRLSPQTCPRLEVTASALNVRPTASTSQAAVGTLHDGDVVDRRSTVEGQNVNGISEWHQIQKGSLVGYVNGAFVECVD